MTIAPNGRPAAASAPIQPRGRHGELAFLALALQRLGVPARPRVSTRLLIIRYAAPRGEVRLLGLVAERPQLIHAFHAFRAGPLGREAARRLAVPLVVTLTGTVAVGSASPTSVPGCGQQPRRGSAARWSATRSAR